MKKIVVSAPSWFPSSGGITILHKFVHTLNDIGYDAYLAPSKPSGLGWWNSNIEFYTPARYNKVKFINEDIYNNLQDAIVVYAESWYGNYLNAPNVVRWMMGLANSNFMNAGNYGQFRYNAWKDDELWFWYSDLYKTQSDKKIIKNLDNDLTLIEFYTDIFLNRSEDRILNCWTLRKGGFDTEPSDYIHDSSDLFFGDIDTSLDDFNFPGQYKRLAMLFNKTKRFYSYDRSTFISVQAAMCGADSIVVPHKKLSKEEYYNGFELHKYVAYGLDEINRAKSIRNELDDHIKEIERKCISDIHLFVEKCNNYFK
jgi:hypothetical protein